MPTYVGTNRTSGTGAAQPGLTALWNLAKQMFPKLSFGGIGRTSWFPGSAKNSVHFEGRAADMMVGQLNDAERIATGNGLANFLVANAEVLGIQEITWNGWHWGYGRWEWRPSKNNGARPDHWNHVHVGMNPTAAKSGTLNLNALNYNYANSFPGQGGGGATPATAPRGTSVSGPTGPGQNGAQLGPVQPPTDGTFVSVAGTGYKYLVYALGENQFIAYELKNDGSVLTSGMPAETLSAEQFRTKYNTAIHGGWANELLDVKTTFGSHTAFWNSVLMQVMGQNPAQHDPEVRRILAEFVGRPDMTEAELQNKLKGTKYYQARTEEQLRWNDYSEAERQVRRDEMVSRMQQSYLQYFGYDVPANDPRIMAHVENLASGKTGFGAWIESVVKPEAKADSESPYARQLRTEQEDRRQRGVENENSAQQVRQLANRWGVKLSEQTIAEWGRGITEKTLSDADVLTNLKQMAQVLYPWKDAEMETSIAAQPWIETYSRVMERNTDLFNPQVQSALTQGTPAWEFEKQLKKSDAWLGTKNAQGELSSMLSSIGAKMGFQ